MTLTELVGHLITDIQSTGEEVIFSTHGGGQLRMYHAQNCCESVWLEDVVGDFRTLLGQVVLSAEETTGCFEDGVSTWTFYHLRCARGDVTLWWNGTGFYSTAVDIQWLP